jgi:broad specificity phosphatase PhoE
VLYQIVANPLASANATAAAIFRKIDADQPSLMLDEIDAQLRDDAEKAAAIRSILNAGYQAGPTATVLRCEGSATKYGSSTPSVQRRSLESMKGRCTAPLSTAVSISGWSASDRIRERDS